MLFFAPSIALAQRAELERRIQRTTLPNGLDVMVVENRGVPLVTIEARFVEVSDNFLRDLGIELPGIAPSAERGLFPFTNDPIPSFFKMSRQMFASISFSAMPIITSDSSLSAMPL